MKVLVAQSCPTLCNPIDCSPPGSSVHGILQASTLEQVAISFSKRNYRKKESEVTQSCLTLCDPMDCSLSGCSVHGILQERILEWVAISFSRGSSRPRDGTQVSCIAGRFFTLGSQGQHQKKVLTEQKLRPSLLSSSFYSFKSP